MSAENTHLGSAQVARRLVMRDSTWEELVSLARTLSERDGFDFSAQELAVLAIEAGLPELRRAATARRGARP